MSLRGLSFEIGAEKAISRAAVWLELTKPRMVGLILVTTVAGFYMASPAQPDYLLLLHTLIGTALVAGGCLALNQVMEEGTDALMERTKHRPLPEGRVQELEALAFGALTVAAGEAYLALVVNPACAFVTASIVAVYLGVYTPMKRTSALCTAIGAIPGALPPVAGWVAASGSFSAGAAAIFGIMFFWQLPHSLAIAQIYREDYGKAGLKLLSTVYEDGRSTGRHMFLNAFALLVASFLPTLLGLTGWIYFSVAFVMGFWMLLLALRAALAGGAVEPARRVLRMSFLYVPVVLLAMTLDRIPFLS